MHNLGKNQWKVNNLTSEIKCKLQLNLLFSYFYRWISNTFSELMDNQLSDVLRDLRDTWLALLCLISWLSDVWVNHLRSRYCQNRSLPSNVRCPYPQNLRSKSVKTSVYKHYWNSFITIFISPADWSCLLCSQVSSFCYANRPKRVYICKFPTVQSYF